MIRDTIMSDPRSLTTPEPFIQVNNPGDFSVDFLVRVWIGADDYFAYQVDMKRQVKEALDAADVAIPFPTRTLNIETDTPDPHHGPSARSREGRARDRRRGPDLTAQRAARSDSPPETSQSPGLSSALSTATRPSSTIIA